MTTYRAWKNCWAEIAPNRYNDCLVTNLFLLQFLLATIVTCAY